MHTKISFACYPEGSNIGMQGTPISVVLLCWHGASAPNAGRSVSGV